jgi:hypothetical protein
MKSEYRIPAKIAKAGGYASQSVLLQPLTDNSYLRVVGLHAGSRATVQLVVNGYVVASVDVPRKQTRTRAARAQFASHWKLIEGRDF